MTTLYQSQQPPKPQVPDPSDSYERSHPEHESGMGRLDNNDKAVPADRPDSVHKAVENAQELRQINTDDVVNGRATKDPVETTDKAKRHGTA